MSSSPINGRFYFVAAPAASIAPKPNPANSGASEVSLAWNAAKDTKSRAVLEAFIKQYGDSFYATLARARLDEIKNAPLAPPQISSPAASVALPTFINANRQRAVLYEEDPDDAKGKQYVGTVVWRTEPVKAAGKPTETSVRADIEIPDRKFKMTLSFRRNTDPSLPAKSYCGFDLHPAARFRGRWCEQCAGYPNEIQRAGSWYAARRPRCKGDRGLLLGRFVQMSIGIVRATYSFSRSAHGSMCHLCIRTREGRSSLSKKVQQANLPSTKPLRSGQIRLAQRPLTDRAFGAACRDLQSRRWSITGGACASS